MANDTGHGILWCLTAIAHKVDIFADEGEESAEAAAERAYLLRCDAQNLAFLAGLHRACGFRPSVVAIAALMDAAAQLDGGAWDG